MMKKHLRIHNHQVKRGKIKGESCSTNFWEKHITQRTYQDRDGTWETPGVEGVQDSARTQSKRIYTEQRQATVEQWVALSPLFEVCSI